MHTQRQWCFCLTAVASLFWLQERLGPNRQGGFYLAIELRNALESMNYLCYFGRTYSIRDCRALTWLVKGYIDSKDAFSTSGYQLQKCTRVVCPLIYVNCVGHDTIKGTFFAISQCRNIRRSGRFDCRIY